jgi:hypothetical protein
LIINKRYTRSDAEILSGAVILEGERLVMKQFLSIVAGFWYRRSALLPIFLVSVLLATTTSFAAPGPAFADPATPPAAGQKLAAKVRLEKTLQREQLALARLLVRLERATSRTTKIQKVIDNQKSKGKDTTALVAALASYNTSIASARTQYDTAKGLLDAHAGFGANGQVTDGAQARDAVKAVAQAEMKVRKTLREANRGLLQVARDYRKAN